MKSESSFEAMPEPSGAHGPVRRFIIRAVEMIHPPQQWMLPVIVAAGTLGGLGMVLLHVSNATSYISDDPRACINCHIMIPQL